MDFGLDIAQHQLTWDEIVRRASFAEDAGFAGVWVFDHFQALYGDPDGPCLESWTLLAALAALTERIRLGALVTGATYRHPSMLAMQAVTVDHLSGGRLEIGLGAGWHEGEHRALGFDFPPVADRVRRLEETVTVVRRLLTEDEVDVDGEHVTLRSATYRPRPVQRPHPPIWLGAGGRRRTIPLAARLADVWHTGGSVEAFRAKAEILDEHARKAGRDPAEIRRASSLDLSQDWDAVRRDVEGYAAAGCDYLVADWPSEGWERIESFASEVMPALR
jgi:F420-dependent oxidoreductase-like protein